MRAAVFQGYRLAGEGAIEHHALAEQSAREQFAADILGEGGDVPLVEDERRVARGHLRGGLA
ncbi:hypothetical protein ACYTSM_25585 [Pseudomonas aeruginosa]|uniref:hypothetical protein n=1 Tax=Pseudomonas aeruginosa TaxID=287 RepID=UPI0021B022A3|nr:hypothetical protein [Pseudomonas aeruginosa]